jgi:SAM-dependent methyltransferase
MVETLVMPAVFGAADAAQRGLGDDVIEIGPGPGFTTDVLRDQVAQLTAVELDEDLAATLGSRLAGTNVTVVLGDASHLDLPADRFTAAVSCNMLHHVPTAELQDAIFGELGRVVRPGGVLVAADSAPRDQLDDFHRGDTLNPIDPETLPQRLAAAGFVDVETSDYDLGWVCSALVGGSS